MLDTQRKRSNTLTDCPKKGGYTADGLFTKFLPTFLIWLIPHFIIPITTNKLPICSAGKLLFSTKKKKSIHIFRPWSRPFFFLLLLRARCHKSIPLLLLLLLLRVLPRKVVLPRGEKCDVTPCHRPSNLLVLNRPGTFCGVHRFSVGVSLSSRVKRSPRGCAPSLKLHLALLHLRG